MVNIELGPDWVVHIQQQKGQMAYRISNYQKLKENELFSIQYKFHMQHHLQSA